MGKIKKTPFGRGAQLLIEADRSYRVKDRGTKEGLCGERQVCQVYLLLFLVGLRCRFRPGARCGNVFFRGWYLCSRLILQLDSRDNSLFDIQTFNKKSS
jgi:hypothetical protein